MTKPFERSTNHNKLHARECGRTGCHEQARFTPHIELFDAGHQPVGQIGLELAACEEHTKGTTPETFIPADHWDQIVQISRQQGKPAPVRGLCKLVWDPMRDATSEEMVEIAMMVNDFVSAQMYQRRLAPTDENARALLSMYAGLASSTCHQFGIDPEKACEGLADLFRTPPAALAPEPAEPAPPPALTDDGRLERLFGARPRGTS